MATTTAHKQVTGEPNVRARYDCDEGTRQLVAQRVRGVVALSDVPAGQEGRVHLVERRLESLAELDADEASAAGLFRSLQYPHVASYGPLALSDP